MAGKGTCFLLLAAVAISVVSASPTFSHRRHKLHHSMRNHHLEHFFNLKSLQDWEDHEYDLVTPSQTEEDGSFLSHDLGKGGLANSRRRRSADNDADVTKEMFYKMHMFGEEHHFRLKRNDEMLHKNFMINIHDKDDMSTHTFDQACFYHGSLKSHDDSDVAMSNCDSELMGIVRKKREVFHVHPLPEYLKKSERNPNSHSHLVYKVKERKATGTVKDIYKHYDEIHRQRRQTTNEPAPANKPDDIFCSEDDIPHGYDNSSLNVDYADTMALQLYEPGFVDRTFGDNFVQAAMFLDHTMVEKHNGDENFLIRYHLSMFNIMSLIYQPSRTTYSVRLVLITLKIYRTPQNGLFITQDSKALLEGFCRYQQTINPRRPSPWRWNHAFLITGYGLCFGSNRDCGELGRAPIEGVCIPDRECSVNREGGLNTAFVLAHELGHNLGMFHDGHPSESRSCPYQDGYLMAPSTGDAKRIWRFSPCSKAHLRRYLRSQDSACMDKGSVGPTINKNLKVTDCSLPGEAYSINRQCELQFKHWENRYYAGHKFKFCSRTSYGRNSICRHLFCDDGNTRRGCYSTYTPAMDGTPCGDGKICYRFNCVNKNTVPADYCTPDLNGPTRTMPPAPATKTVTDAAPTTSYAPTAPPTSPVDGAWSPFSAYSQCSQSCGPGIRYRMRLCNNPAPANGGKDCAGSSVDYDLCNMENCPINQGYAEQTCRKYGGNHWVPVQPAKDTPATQQCQLICRNTANRQTGLALNQVPDGMPCYSGYCLLGKCSLGCDGKLNSGAKFDDCGMCGGDGSSCRINSGTVNHTVNQTTVYHSVNLRGTGSALLRGSWDISIREDEVTPSNSTVFALRDNNPLSNVPNHYYLNGPNTQTKTGVYEFNVAGARGRYENTDGYPERLTITGYINRPLIVEVKVVGVLDRSSLRVAFNFTSPVLSPKEKFFWRLIKDWSACTVTCGTGLQGREHRCVNKLTDSTARDDQCIKAGKPRPVFYRPCYNRDCRFIRTATSVASAGQCKNCLMLVERNCVGYDADNNTVKLPPRDCGDERMAVVRHCGGGACMMTMSSVVTAMCTSVSPTACTGDVQSIMCAQDCAELEKNSTSVTSSPNPTQTVKPAPTKPAPTTPAPTTPATTTPVTTKPLTTKSGTVVNSVLTSSGSPSGEARCLGSVLTVISTVAAALLAISL